MKRLSWDKVVLAFVLLLSALVLLLLWWNQSPRFVDIGNEHDRRFVSDFFLPETDTSTTFRWSSSQASLRFYGVIGGPSSLSMRLNGDVRSRQQSAQIQLLKQDQLLANFDAVEGWRVYHILLPAPSVSEQLTAASQVTLQTQPFIYERRSLGVPVDWLVFGPVGSQTQSIYAAFIRAGAYTWLLVGVMLAIWVFVRAWFARSQLVRFTFVILGTTGLSIGLLFWTWRDLYLVVWWLPPAWALGWGTVLALAPFWALVGRWIINDAQVSTCAAPELERRWGISAAKTVPTLAASRRSAFFWYSVYALVAVLFSVFYIASTVEYEDATLQSLTAFEAFVPYQYRVLLPAFVHTLTWFIPVSLFAIYSILTVICTFLTIVTFRTYLSLVIDDPLVNWYALIIVYPMVWNYALLSIFYYPSDILAIVLFQIGLLCLIFQRWRWYYIVFIAASFNRETSCFLTFAYIALYWNHIPFKKLVSQSIVQLFLWLLIKAWLGYLFNTNFGDRVFQNQISNNIALIRDIFMFQPFALVRLMTFGAIWLFIPLAWRQQPILLKRLLWVVVPFIAGMSIVGLLHEARIYSELIPIVTAPALYGIHQKLRFWYASRSLVSKA